MFEIGTVCLPDRLSHVSRTDVSAFPFSEVRIELSLPGFGLQDLSYPTSFPSPPSEHLENDAARAWYYYLAEIALRRLANRILHHLFRNQEEGRFFRIAQMVESTATFESQAADW